MVSGCTLQGNVLPLPSLSLSLCLEKGLPDVSYLAIPQIVSIDTTFCGAFQIAGELSGSTSVSLEGKFKALEGNNAVDDELAKMKGLVSCGPLLLTAHAQSCCRQCFIELRSILLR